VALYHKDSCIFVEVNGPSICGNCKGVNSFALHYKLRRVSSRAGIDAIPCCWGRSSRMLPMHLKSSAS
jgi:hypothetical protein